MQRTIGNLLGAAQAEADRAMLQRAFIETADYQALLHTSDFSYVVGRRGTGKSAIFQRLKEVFAADTGLVLMTEEPQDFEMLELQALLKAISSEYRVLRPIQRLLWTVIFLLKSVCAVSRHYKFHKCPQSSFLNDYFRTHCASSNGKAAVNCSGILRDVLKQTRVPEAIPGTIATRYQIGPVTEALREVLDAIGLRIITLYDRLDEAWIPETVPVAILGGLARMAADFREKRLPFYPVVFIRDNMFRALAQFDDDFTRHIEGHTLRLQWEEESLLYLITARLRVALGLETVESNIKVWNRFAHRALHNREGFARCLRYTLFRPRDILVLLNEAHVNALREGRDEIIENDIEKSATNISQHRMEDLCKEYDKVLPGLRLFVSAFRGKPASQSFQGVVDHLQYIADHNDYNEAGARDLVLFENGGEMFSALYSVGFIGLKDTVSGNYTFCHDGSMSALVRIDGIRETLVHPCYWKALDISVLSGSEELLIQINDECEVKSTSETADLRLQRLGRMPEELSHVAIGQNGSRSFETWVQRAVRLLFSGSLSNIELKPNPSTALNQRDVVATNSGKGVFWRRIYDDYQSRQVIFECKNYEEVTPEDFRQVLDYSTGEYGKFAVIVRRGNNEVVTENEKDRTRALFFEHKRLILIVPAAIFVLCIRKLRTPKKYDYAEFTISKHMDWVVRSVLSMTHAPRYKIKRKK